MTPQEMATNVAMTYNNAPDHQKEIILDAITEILGVTKESFILFAGYTKLFSDQNYYNAVRKAIGETIWKNSHPKNK